MTKQNLNERLADIDLDAFKVDEDDEGNEANPDTNTMDEDLVEGREYVNRGADIVGLGCWVRVMNKIKFIVVHSFVDTHIEMEKLENNGYSHNTTYPIGDDDGFDGDEDALLFQMKPNNKENPDVVICQMWSDTIITDKDMLEKYQPQIRSLYATATDAETLQRQRVCIKKTFNDTVVMNETVLREYLDDDGVLH